MNDLEKKWAAVTVAVCGTSLGVIAALSALWRVAASRGVIMLAGTFGTILCGLGLWLCAWECGRRFEREHGERVCGAVSDDEGR